MRRAPLQILAFAALEIRASFCSIGVPVSLRSRRVCIQLTSLTRSTPDLQGWQLDKLAANPKKQAEEESDTDSDEDIPFACILCRKSYTDPVVTRCGHYFCSKCAIKRFAKTPKCAACGSPTGGIFNRADKVIAKLKKKKEDEDAGEQEGEEGGSTAAGGVQIEGLAGQKGEDGSDEDEDEDSD